ncbi:MAG TPA: ECF transporter S component [Erysipelotrichaceae bacterium]|nr:ECF transporter S component [Erysipelotrichaceae bacterium]
MITYDTIRHTIAIVLLVILLAKFISKMFFRNNEISTRFIARTAVFSAVAIVLYTIPFLNFSLPIFPAFLKIHLDEVPAFFAGFAYGPFSGFLVILIKTIVKLPMTSTAGVGELADFIYSVAFVVPAAFIYKKMHNLKGAFVSLLVATIVQILVASFVTTFVMLDVYVALYPGLTKEAILLMCQTVNPAIRNLQFDFLLMVSVPFNALKDVLVVFFTFVFYKRLRLLFMKFETQKN